MVQGLSPVLRQMHHLTVRELSVDLCSVARPLGVNRQPLPSRDMARVDDRCGKPALAKAVDQIVVTGKTAVVPHAESTFQRLGDLYGVTYSIPRFADFSTAIGAAVSISTELEG